MEIKECLLTKNECYLAATPMSPKGIVVHSTGVNNPYLKRYVQPNDGILGENTYQNSWNRPGVLKCVHAFIGKDQEGTVRIYQTLPYSYAAWGVGKGSKGSYNYNPTGHLQFEMCEDDLKDANYYHAVIEAATDYCANLCKTYNLSVNSIVSHKEAHDLGYGSNHGDPENWLSRFGQTMDDFRWMVAKKLEEPVKPTPESDPEPQPQEPPFEIGDRVLVNGYLYADSFGNGRGVKKKNYKTTVALVAKNYERKCPYNVFGKSGQYLGWVSKDALKKY